MTDYIERELDGQEEEDGREAPEVTGASVHRRLPRKRRGAAKRSEVQGGRPAAEPDGEQVQRAAANGGDRPAAERETKTERKLADAQERGRAGGSDGFLTERRRGGAPGLGAGTVERALRRTRVAAEYRGVQTRWETAPAPGGGSTLYTDLDAAAERDARRYDGGFELF